MTERTFQTRSEREEFSWWESINDNFSLYLIFMAKLSYKSPRNAIKLLAMLNIESLVIKGREIRTGHARSRKNLLNVHLEVYARYGFLFIGMSLNCLILEGWKNEIIW